MLLLHPVPRKFLRGCGMQCINAYGGRRTGASRGLRHDLNTRTVTDAEPRNDSRSRISRHKEARSNSPSTSPSTSTSRQSRPRPSSWSHA
ncbi:hypothetical protein SCHPADRAFT_478814 [Schizopora paradoxa]|uniref:Uncharacterized protein n=1 Tax=Schizopora paradoxa TaxID=27342 RepID=A0A0H2RHD0_9AGAM|nr:hypothetical protein SCHPADRAFT_478814 [Schizopora paradoxa]